jgi:DNA-binding MarR family transcriptional regulator
VNEKTLEIIRLPLLHHDYLEKLPQKQKELARFIIKNKAKNYSQVELAKKLNKKKSTINVQVKELKKLGIVELKDSDDGKSKLVVPTEGIELIFG